MTLRSKIAAFHARIHSHRPHSHHFHLPGHSKDKRSSPSGSPSRGIKPLKFKKSSKSPGSHHASGEKRDSLSSTGSSSVGANDERRSSNGSGASGAPSPVLTLILPTHIQSREESNVEARVYHPTEFPEGYGVNPGSPRKAAVVAHPYASLGGSWDDPVVLALVGLLTAKGWVVATFNFGGAGNSKGKTSWTGGPEREEYATVATFLIKYVECLDPNTFTVPSPNSPQARSPIAPSDSSKRPHMKVLLAGYSYGSLIASRTPSAEKLLKTHSLDDGGDVLAYATRTAYEWASTEKRRSFAMARGAGKFNPWGADNDDDEEEAGQGSSGENEADKTQDEEEAGYAVREKLETSYLLVSPLLAPVAFLLTLPNPLSWFQKKKKDDTTAGDVGGEEQEEADTLAVYGTDDMFTGAGRYRTWAKGRTEKTPGKFKAVEVEGASHFWFQEEGWMVKLREGVVRWLDGLDVKDNVGAV